MKKHLMTALMTVLCVLAFAVVALADADVKYVQEDGTRVYEDKDTDSDVYAVLSAGDRVLIEFTNGNGSWSAILVEDPDDDDDGQVIGWIRSKRLGDTIPQSRCTHDFGPWNVESEPSCTEPGYAYRYCSICGIMDEKEEPALGHSFGQWTVQTKPTCTQTGTQVRTCSRCGAVEATDIPTVDHTFGNWQVTKKPTCTAEGEQQRTCSVCGYKETQSIEKIPHKYGEWKITKKATCTEEGERVHTCTVCRQEEKETIEKLPHDFEDKITKEATDHSAGTRIRVCKVCGFKTDEESFDPEGTLRVGASGEEVVKMQELLIDQGFLAEGTADGKFGSGTENALKEFQLSQNLEPDGVAWPQTLKRLNHDYGPWTITKPVSRTGEGERTRVCKDCGYEQTQALIPTPNYVRQNSGDDIASIQKMITAVGFDAGDVDGVFGRKLNEAFTNLAKERGFVFTEDKITAGNLDELVNAWIGKTAAQAKGEGTQNDPVSLALTAKEVEDDSDEILSFEYTLQNLGTENTEIRSIILSVGENPDFTKDVIVLAVDGRTLEAKGANTVTGTFEFPAEGFAAPEEIAEEETEELPGEAETEEVTEAETEETVIEAETEAEELVFNICALTQQGDAVWSSNVITLS